MSETNLRTRRKAAQMLVLATLFWGASFPVMKSLALAQQELLPRTNRWFFTAAVILARFGGSAVILLALSWRNCRQMTRLEVWQGLGLGLFCGAGMLLQMDGLVYTAASTSAFLTQCSCLLLPFLVALRDQKWPAAKILAACVLVILGVAVLARVDLRRLHLGRGEWETLGSAVMFTFQILWLERPVFARNRVAHSSMVMFASMAILSMPLALWTTPDAGAWITAFSSVAILGFMSILVVCCTLASFILMNRWQPHIPAAEAGLIYGAEPVFASAFALFLPGWCSAWAGINYDNELLTWNLVVGGGLITAANILVQIQNSSAHRSWRPRRNRSRSTRRSGASRS